MSRFLFFSLLNSNIYTNFFPTHFFLFLPQSSFVSRSRWKISDLVPHSHPRLHDDTTNFHGNHFLFPSTCLEKFFRYYTFTFYYTFYPLPSFAVFFFPHSSSLYLNFSFEPRQGSKKHSVIIFLLYFSSFFATKKNTSSSSCPFHYYRSSRYCYYLSFSNHTEILNFLYTKH